MGLYLRHPASLRHDTGAHPENARRIVAIERALSDRDWLGLELAEAPAASREQLLRVHDGQHVEAIERLCDDGGGMIDLDTVASADSFEAALRAAGGACAGVDRLLAGDHRFAISALRPPGHHAEAGQAMGFCLFNNAAVAAGHALASGVERVLILDWDVHHGNGTEAIFETSDRVVYASIHQWPLYPGTGAAEHQGSGEGEGYTVNLPVPAGSGSEEFLAQVQHVVDPLARSFGPGLLIISAGFDAHRADPLADCAVETGGYGDMAARMRLLADDLDVPVLVCLEGGYDVDALADSVIATLIALGDSSRPPQAPIEPARAHRDRVARRWELPG